MQDLVQLIFAVFFLVFLVYLVGRILVKPFKLVFKILFNSIFGLLLLWGYNFIGNYLGIIIPINLLTVLIAGFLGIPGLILLIILNFILGG
ncbi:pro-sigmaK processing inhibitor BofA family protein [Zhaonella formicivorans]|uniref:pro-sigmaK processing inhibitor BofA family protein n=1 Tax=Zhaonella formicivorans TaxID=2528593 RepID=UPI0010DFBCFC|nr:pro-sigmaK processing inhibitor BofA family protein [Zhaonella formicivorans]